MTVNEQHHSEAERAFRADRARESRMARKTLESATGERSALLQEAVRGRLSTRELADLYRDRKESIGSDAVGTSEPVCAADRLWVPSVADLTPEWRKRASSGNPEWQAGYLQALVDTGTEAAFAPGRWRD